MATILSGAAVLCCLVVRVLKKVCHVFGSVPALSNSALAGSKITSGVILQPANGLQAVLTSNVMHGIHISDLWCSTPSLWGSPQQASGGPLTAEIQRHPHFLTNKLGDVGTGPNFQASSFLLLPTLGIFIAPSFLLQQGADLSLHGPEASHRCTSSKGCPASGASGSIGWAATAGRTSF